MTREPFSALSGGGWEHRGDKGRNDMITSTVSNGGIGRRLLNVREAAQYLGLEVDTVYKKARLREVPCVKVGRALRFDVQALERFIEQHTIETID
jgi:excisionase family DNA binding protein